MKILSRLIGSVVMFTALLIPHHLYAAPGNPADWVVGTQTFQSNYPLGFEFTATITSSAGEITRARIIWTHAPGSGTQRSRPAEIDPKTGALYAVWEATSADAVPPWVGVTYYWDVTDTEGNSYQTDPQYAEYEDTSREWVRTESDDVIVFAESLPEEVGPMTADAMAEQRETYRAAWGGLLPYKPRAILFGDRVAWLEWQGVTASNILGTTRDDWGATVQIVSGGNLEDLAYGTVLHEIAHIYQTEFSLMGGVSWFNEGNATFFELYQSYDYEGRVRQLAAENKLLPLLRDSGPSIRGDHGRDGYDIGYTFWKWFTANYGLDGHRQLIELLDTGITRTSALEQITGLALDEIESRWRVWIGASAQVPTLIPTETLFFFPTLTPFGQ
ncbi:MAG TPA: hypothetical protein VHP83_21905 [Aggregatilineaceae bacterium]|nr:hypothetical protein [Aggregatilineaceae bacterium]